MPCTRRITRTLTRSKFPSPHAWVFNPMFLRQISDKYPDKKSLSTNIMISWFRGEDSAPILGTCTYNKILKYASDVVPYLMTDADESTLHARLYYVPQYKLKMLFNRVLENYTAADTYPNSSIAVNDADKFYKCVCIEAALLHYSANAMAYIDFIMHHFEPGNNRQTCADRRSIFVNKMRLDDSFVTHDLPTSCLLRFVLHGDRNRRYFSKRTTAIRRFCVHHPQHDLT